MSFVFDHTTGGRQGKENYICNESVDDVLIFGSSRAVGHYNSSILEDSLGMSTFNCGESGNGIILAYGRLKMIQSRHKPKIVIYDLYPNLDMFKGNNKKDLGELRHYYDKDNISDIFEEVDPTEKFKMISGMYKYNSTFLQTLFTYMTSLSHSTGEKGFRPKVGNMNKMKVFLRDIEGNNAKSKDDVKFSFLDKFTNEVDSAKLYFVLSPIWCGMEQDEVAIIEEYCLSHNISFVNFSNNPKYIHHDELFIDGNHLNSKGADEFTKDLIRYLKN